MRHSIIIIISLFCQNLFGQIKLGTYSQLDTSFSADLKLYPDNKFDFYDTRDGSCWVWTHYKGDWKLKEDSIIFSWQSNWSENSDSMIFNRDSKTTNLVVQFLYDDGKPISKVKTSLSCLFDDNTKLYYSDNAGKVTIPGQICREHDRMFYYEVKNNIIKLSSNKSIDYFTDSLSNIFTVIIKKKPKSFTTIKTKKYLIKGETLVDVDPKEYNSLNWGDFIYR